MEIRDYVGMLRRGWPAIFLITALFLGLTVGYLQIAPKSYEAHAVVYVSANNPTTFSDLAQGGSFAGSVVNTYAELIDSAAVLAPAATSLTPTHSVDELSEIVEAQVRAETHLIDIVVTGSDPEDVTAVANAVAASAEEVVPRLESARRGEPWVKVAQVREAVEPTNASSPVVRRTLVLGLMVGLCVGLGVTIAAQALDTRLRRVDDIRALTAIPVLAILPPLSRAERRGLVVRDQPGGAAAEAFRRLRTNMRFRESRARRSFVIASVIDTRDAVSVSTNLAWTLAQTGQHVLLVDLDLRRSAVGDWLGLDAAAGVADVLMGQKIVSEVTRTTSHAQLDVVLSGTQQPSPSDLLSSAALAALLREVEQTYDYVIVNAPPVLAYTDTALISGAAGGTFVTVTAGRTRAQELTSALATFGNVHVTPLGMVLTGARRSALEHGTISHVNRRSSGATASARPADWDFDTQEIPAQKLNRS